MAKRRAEDSADEGPAARGGPRAAAMSPESRKDKFALYLKALNKQFSKWVSSQAESNSGELWRDGVKDYLKHADKLMEDFADVVKAEIASPSSAAASPAAAPAFGSSAFGSSPIKFGASAGGGSSAPSLFGQPPAASSGPGASPAAPSSLFSFGGGAPAAAASTGGGLFSFQPSPAAAPAGAPQNNGGGDGDADDDDEPKRASSPSLKDDDTVEKKYDLLWSNKSKLFLQPEGESGWNDAGVGIFSLRRMKEGQGSSTPYMVFMSSSGKALLNASLYKGLTPTIGKNAKLVLMKLVVSGSDGTTSDKMVLVKFAKDEITKECKDKVEELSPK